MPVVVLAGSLNSWSQPARWVSCSSGPLPCQDWQRNPVGAECGRCSGGLPPVMLVVWSGGLGPISWGC